MLRIKGKEGLWAPHLLVKNMPAEGARKYNSPLGSMSMSARVNASGPGHWAVVDNAARLQQKMNETERYMRYGFPSSDTPPLNASAAAAARNYLAAGNAHYAAVKNYYK